jgi:hypothetical protein
MKEKERYYSPETFVIEVKYEGVICASGDPLPDSIVAPGFLDGGELL